METLAAREAQAIAPRRPPPLAALSPPAAPRTRHWWPRPVRPISTVCPSRPGARAHFSAFLPPKLHTARPDTGPDKRLSSPCPPSVRPQLLETVNWKLPQDASVYQVYCDALCNVANETSGEQFQPPRLDRFDAWP